MKSKAMNKEAIEEFKKDLVAKLDRRRELAYFSRWCEETKRFVKVLDNDSIYNKPPRFVTAYATTRHYGGAEEGGWWYNWDECLETKSIPPCDDESMKAVLISIAEQWCEEYAHEHHGDIYSVLGGSEVWFALEYHAGEKASKETPRYE